MMKKILIIMACSLTFSFSSNYISMDTNPILSAETILLTAEPTEY
ncbi:hypothetical protein [Longirhabdus pacifica]|nr:hypothetical protein [Longirhabdus pacifica]